jgi:hypothetical protein
MAIAEPDKTVTPQASSAPVRLLGWGGGATLALGVLALTLQTEAGSQQLRTAFATTSPPQVVAKVETKVEAPPAPPEKDAETKRLETLVLALANDRERLNARIAGLERSLEDMTGSIKQQQAALAAKPATPPPVIAAPVIAPLTMAPARDATPSSPWHGNVAPQAADPVPQTKVASAPAVETPDEPPRKPEVGIDLGGAANLDVLNARWVAVKANFGPMLSGLYPRAAQNHRQGSSDYRLIVGPLPNNATAAALCARFVAARITCRTTKFDGEKLAQR